ncbi:MAG: zinc metalloprotease HtpX [Thermoanaerobaculales bacterium]|nr:zinc metalloprotease HtpX [Thermoanaerobaculales bacterium]
MTNFLKTTVLMTILTVLFVWVGGVLGGREGAVLAFLMAAGMNFFAYFFSDKMVLSRYRAKEVGPESELYEMVARLADRAGLPMPKVYVIPDQAANAFATGRNPRHAAVAATEGILRTLDREELEGVMAHELAHVKHRDILTGTIAATFAGALAMMGRFAVAGQGRSGNRNPIGLLIALVAAPAAAMAIRMTISRVREYAADAGGADISGNPDGLADALVKISQAGRRGPTITNLNSAHSHLFIANPLRGVGGLAKLFASHPPMEERVRRLRAMAS